MIDLINAAGRMVGWKAHTITIAFIMMLKIGFAKVSVCGFAAFSILKYFDYIVLKFNDYKIEFCRGCLKKIPFKRMGFFINEPHIIVYCHQTRLAVFGFYH